MNILSLQEFADTEKKDTELALDMNPDTDQPERMLIYADTCYLEEFTPRSESRYGGEDYKYCVTICNNWYPFVDKQHAIKYLYTEWYIPECTELLRWK